MSFKYPDLQERQQTAAAAKKAMLEKFKAAVNDPTAAEKHAARHALHQARLARMAEREAANEAAGKAREAELAAQAARKAELAAKARREAEEAAARAEAEAAERTLSLLTEQKVARDARYAARKAAKKARRRGY